MVVIKYLLSSHHPDIFLCSLNFLVDANMVNLIFFDMVRESTCGHVDPFIRKDAFCYYKMIEEACVCKSLAVFVHVAQSLCAHDFIVPVFSAPFFAL